jgi:hypothetical protein
MVIFQIFFDKQLGLAIWRCNLALQLKDFCGGVGEPSGPLVARVLQVLGDSRSVNVQDD